MRRKKFQIVAALLAAFFVVGLHGTAEAASENDDVTVNFVRVDKNGYGYIQISANTAGSPPACGTSNGYANSLAFDTNTPGGKSILSVATAAMLAGRKIHTYGNSTCTLYGVMEDVNLVLIK